MNQCIKNTGMKGSLKFFFLKKSMVLEVTVNKTELYNGK